MWLCLHFLALPNLLKMKQCGSNPHTCFQTGSGPPSHGVVGLLAPALMRECTALAGTKYLFLSPFLNFFFLFYFFYIMASCQASAVGRQSWTRSGHALCRQPWTGSGGWQRPTSVRLSAAEGAVVCRFRCPNYILGIAQHSWCWAGMWPDMTRSFPQPWWQQLAAGDWEGGPEHSETHGQFRGLHSPPPPPQSRARRKNAAHPSPVTGRWGTLSRGQGTTKACTAWGRWPQMPGGWEGSWGALGEVRRWGGQELKGWQGVGGHKAGQAWGIQDDGDRGWPKVESSMWGSHFVGWRRWTSVWEHHLICCGLVWGELRLQSPRGLVVGMSKAPPSDLSKTFLRTVAIQVSHQERCLRLWSRSQPTRWLWVAQIWLFWSTQGTLCSKSSTKHFWLRNFFTAS